MHDDPRRRDSKPSLLQQFSDCFWCFFVPIRLGRMCRLKFCAPRRRFPVFNVSGCILTDSHRLCFCLHVFSLEMWGKALFGFSSLIEFKTLPNWCIDRQSGETRDWIKLWYKQSHNLESLGARTWFHQQNKEKSIRPVWSTRSIGEAQTFSTKGNRRGSEKHGPFCAYWRAVGDDCEFLDSFARVQPHTQLIGSDCVLVSWVCGEYSLLLTCLSKIERLFMMRNASLFLKAWPGQRRRMHSSADSPAWLFWYQNTAETTFCWKPISHLAAVSWFLQIRLVFRFRSECL